MHAFILLLTTSLLALAHGADVCPTQVNRDAFDDPRFGCNVRHTKDRVAARDNLSLYNHAESFDFSRLTCAFCGGAANDSLSTVIEELAQKKARECRKMVVYGVSFGQSYTARMSFLHEKAEELHQEFGECFFRFTSLEDMEQLVRGKRPVRLRVFGDKAAHFEDITKGVEKSRGMAVRPYSDNLHLMVPVDMEGMPHRKPRRNVKIFKMLAHRIFPWAERILWVDAKLKVSLKMSPTEYFKRTIEASGACAAFMGLPQQEGTRVTDHRDRIEAAMRKRSVTDNPAALRAQADFYVGEYGESVGENAMVDTALIARDYTSERCRRFNTVLGCAWYDEVQCFSDRDQVSLPYVIAKVLGSVPAAAESLLTKRPPTLEDNDGNAAVLIIPSFKRRDDKPKLYEGMTHWYTSDRAAIYGNRPGTTFWEEGETDLA